MLATVQVTLVPFGQVVARIAIVAPASTPEEEQASNRPVVYGEAVETALRTHDVLYDGTTGVRYIAAPSTG